METEERTIPIRSFRVCFKLERRIHKIDRWRLPLPYGLPVRAIGYFAVVLALVVVLKQLPIAGALLRALHPVLSYVVLPVGAAYALNRWRIDGRLPHAVGLAWLRMRLEPARVAAFRPAEKLGRVELGSVTLVADGRGSRLRRGVVTGPARVLLRYPTRMRRRGRTLRLRQQEGEPLWRGKQVDLRKGQRVVVE